MNVLFVNMPFAAIRPAIGVSLLKSHLERVGVSSQIIYLNMRFAQLLDAPSYGYIAELAPTQSLAGDWVFSCCAFGQRDDADEAYLHTFAQRFRVSSNGEAVTTLKRARDVAERF